MIQLALFESPERHRQAPTVASGGTQCTVYLGTHQPAWLGRFSVPLFVSRRRLAHRRRLPRALGIWALDSGGFSEISLHGRWEHRPAAYVAEVRRFREEVGGLQWAAIQDWMCEPFMLQRTGLSLEEHQRRTVDSYAQLLDAAPDVPWAPVLQGWQAADYLRCLELYEARGFELRRAPIVGLGSVCRRQHTSEAEGFIRELAGHGLRLHGFGFKVRGLLRVQNVLASSDSLAWSFEARRKPPLEGCAERHKNCANCERYALRWLHKLHNRLAAPRGAP
jgi:hypothetical protein